MNRDTQDYLQRVASVSIRSLGALTQVLQTLSTDIEHRASAHAKRTEESYISVISKLGLDVHDPDYLRVAHILASDPSLMVVDVQSKESDRFQSIVSEYFAQEALTTLSEDAWRLTIDFQVDAEEEEELDPEPPSVAPSRKRNRATLNATTPTALNPAGEFRNDTLAVPEHPQICVSPPPAQSPSMAESDSVAYQFRMTPRLASAVVSFERQFEIDFSIPQDGEGSIKGSEAEDMPNVSLNRLTFGADDTTPILPRLSGPPAAEAIEFEDEYIPSLSDRDFLDPNSRPSGPSRHQTLEQVEEEDDGHFFDESGEEEDEEDDEESEGQNVTPLDAHEIDPLAEEECSEEEEEEDEEDEEEESEESEETEEYEVKAEEAIVRPEPSKGRRVPIDSDFTESEGISPANKENSRMANMEETKEGGDEEYEVTKSEAEPENPNVSALSETPIRGVPPAAAVPKAKRRLTQVVAQTPGVSSNFFTSSLEAAANLLKDGAVRVLPSVTPKAPVAPVSSRIPSAPTPAPKTQTSSKPIRVVTPLAKLQEALRAGQSSTASGKENQAISTQIVHREAKYAKISVISEPSPPAICTPAYIGGCRADIRVYHRALTPLSPVCKFNSLDMEDPNSYKMKNPPNQPLWARGHQWREVVIRQKAWNPHSLFGCGIRHIQYRDVFQTPDYHRAKGEEGMRNATWGLSARARTWEDDRKACGFLEHEAMSDAQTSFMVTQLGRTVDISDKAYDKWELCNPECRHDLNRGQPWVKVEIVKR